MLEFYLMPSVFIAVALFTIPELPKWLVMQNRVEQARLVLLKTNDNDREVEERLEEIQKAAGNTNED